MGNSAALLAGQAADHCGIGRAPRNEGTDAARTRALWSGSANTIPQFEPAEPPIARCSALPACSPCSVGNRRVVSVRSVPAGAVVGYNGTFVATEPMRLALVAAGYADGLDRRLGNRFSLLVRGQRAPLVGRISMDQAVLDVTDIPAVVVRATKW